MLWVFQLWLFRSAMVAAVERLDARSFFFYAQLIVFMFFGLVRKYAGIVFVVVARSVAEPPPPKLYNFGHSLTFRGCPVEIEEQCRSNRSGQRSQP